MSAEVTPTIYSRHFDLAWREFVDANPKLNNPNLRRAYLAGWTAMYATVSAKA